MQESLGAILDRHREAFDNSFKGDQIAILDQISHAFLKALKAGNKIMFCGNGGSASDSQHIAAEFVGRFKLNRRSLPAIALTTDTSIITAVANDYDFDSIFSRQVQGLGQKGDILVAISTSGQSSNVLKAVEAAKELEMITVGMSGREGGALNDTTDMCFIAKSPETSHIQEMHITAMHAISEVVEEVFFGS